MGITSTMILILIYPAGANNTVSWIKHPRWCPICVVSTVSLHLCLHNFAVIQFCECDIIFLSIIWFHILLHLNLYNGVREYGCMLFRNPADESADLPDPVEHYLLPFDGFLNLRRFTAMPCNGDKLTVFEMQIGVAGWIWRWHHWGQRGVLKGRCIEDDVDLAFVRCYDEADYKPEPERASHIIAIRCHPICQRFAKL